MRTRILWNDLKGNRLQAVTTWLFMAVSAFLLALTCLLSVGLLGAVDTLMAAARTPDFLQMHAGEADEAALARFAGEQEQVLDYQTLRFLNLENSDLMLGGHSLADSTQDNGVCVQSGRFDYLVDLENRVIEEVRSGEIYVPVCYRQKYGLETGEAVRIGDVSLTIAGFLRDSQMNAMLASSKRFLVSRTDYDRLKSQGSEESLIEFLLREGADATAFAAAYADAGLPANGPAITKPLIRMMNALSDGLMILVILLVSGVLVLISMLCIRFTLLTRLEADSREIGMLKAVGIPNGEIRELYLLKFRALAGLGAAAGLLAAFLARDAVSARMRELYGASSGGLTGFLAAAAGAAVTEGILLLSVRRTLKRAERLTAVEALNGQGGRLPSRYGIVAVVIALGVFLMILPQNLLSTISDPGFVTYMGIGDGEIRLDLRQTEEIGEKTARVEQLLAREEQVARFTALRTGSCRVALPDGSWAGMQVEQGDHTVFPVAYAAGQAPRQEDEIALSWLWAEELGVSVGDGLTISAGDRPREYRVCGIYPDITNGGKTAKAASLPGGGPLMWSVIYVSLKDGVPRGQWLAGFGSSLSDRGIAVKAVDIQEYVTDTYGQTIQEIRGAARVAVLAAVLVMFTVVALFTRLLTERDRRDISLRKALGFTGGEIKRLYLGRLLPVLLAGIAGGILAGNLLGERLAGLLLQTLGAAGFRFLPDCGVVLGLMPGITAVTVLCGAALGLREADRVRAYECCKGKE
ncbi:ABC transporter permease [Dysosmobacter sp.]|uniref:ABC transporter permease n=1 Tax=Dysosmobacter sp. TaxID=2591382 RepID=UPI002A8B4787|nr:ABC transporter permease [Dysosmobacter sp.]MDY3281667.1 ABC transporter permease [Dysosmobacter sp.]